MDNVTQADREAAADVWRDYIARIGEVITERCMREGGLDDGLPSIFARARIEACAAFGEELAKVADEYAHSSLESQTQCRTEGDVQGAVCHSMARAEAVAIASAIRQRVAAIAKDET